MSDLDAILVPRLQRRAEKNRARTEQGFFVSKAEIVVSDHELSINLYKEAEHEAVEYAPPIVIMEGMAGSEEKIAKDRQKLEKARR